MISHQHVLDLDDKVLHYLLLFGGMVAASALHRLADAFGWDTIHQVRKFFRHKKHLGEVDCSR